MSNSNINTSAIKEEIENLKSEKNKLDALYDDLDKDAKELDEYWKTGTSEEFFSSFNDFQVRFKEVIDFFKNDIEFLNNTVISNYSEYEETTNKKINDDIAI